MKPNYKTAFGALALGLALSTSSIVSADDSSQLAASRKALVGVPAPELPAQAAKLVSQAKAKEQKSVTIAVVRAAVQRTPVAAPFIVSAVAKSVPSVAPVAAATAAALEPKQAGPIAKAAAAAAPSQAGEIVFAICKELPASYAIVAIGASEAAPEANAEILAAVSRAVPSMKRFIDLAINASLPRDDYASALVGTIQQAQNLAGTPLVAPPPPDRNGFTPGTQGNGDPVRKNQKQTPFVIPGQGNVYSGP